MKIAIIKYGMGNVASVKKAIDKLGYTSIITNEKDEIQNSDFIILPGVGSFKKGIENLKDNNLVEILNEEVITNNKPFLGICLGMQLLATYGTEPEKVKGLGWIEGEVHLITPSKNTFRVPHLGWNSVSTIDHNFFSEYNKKDFYFIHSYHFIPNDNNLITLTVDYDGHKVAGLQKNNIYAMQFHPEKSQDIGLNLLKKIIGQYA